jgi:pantoate--beta-alanine ligase
MRIVRTIADVRDALADARVRGERIGLVPTMGALHAGHLALVAAARAECDVVVVSIFVNARQFDRPDDLARYPRDEAADVRTAAAADVDLLFVPSDDELYPAGFATTVDPGPLGSVLEGASRPGHFAGVATICTKLFAITAPHTAWFGQKDAQQVAVVRRVAADLDLALDIRAVPTVRDEDGVALSSRNARLSASEREAARALPRALEAGAEADASGADAVAAARKVLAVEPRLDVDYVSIADFDGPTLLGAVRIGDTRLIDNRRLGDGGR